MNKKLLLCSVFSVALLFGAGFANAASVSIPVNADAKAADVAHENFKGKHERMPLEDKLGLSDEQKEQAKKIHEQGRKEMEPMMNEMKDLREKMDTIRKNNMAEFEKILTPEQKTKLDEMKAKMDERMKEFKEKHGDRKGPHHRHHGDMIPPMGGEGMLPPPPEGDVPSAPAEK